MTSLKIIHTMWLANNGELYCKCTYQLWKKNIWPEHVIRANFGHCENINKQNCRIYWHIKAYMNVFLNSDAAPNILCYLEHSYDTCNHDNSYHQNIKFWFHITHAKYDGRWMYRMALNKILKYIKNRDK